MSISWRALLAGLILAPLCAGCSDGRPPVYTVTGQVLVNGKPAAGAFVVFHPRESTAATPGRPYATTDTDGTFNMTTFESGDGAPAGTYQVTVVWRPTPKSTMDADGVDRLQNRYASPASSGLEAVVQQGPTTLQPYRLSPP